MVVMAKIFLSNHFSHYRYPETVGSDSDNDSMASSVEFELGLGKKKATFGKLLGNVTRSAKNAAKGLGLPTELARRQRSREEKEEEKLGRLATDIAATDGVQVSRWVENANDLISL